MARWKKICRLRIEMLDYEHIFARKWCNVVHLDMTGIDKMNGECFGRVPTEMPHLRLLDLKQCNRIKDELIESVVRQKKDLTAFNYYGEEMEYGI